jgi:WXXGXW repeat (2 copies)
MIERKEVHAMRTISSIRSLFFALFLLCLSASSHAQVSIGISVGYAPPPLPVYEQPICPEEGYIWTPGYWAWDGDDYFWVPGTWVLAPEPGFLWTPAYWGWGGAAFVFHEGYWGPRVGFYGGINYGFGYFGRGYEGGRWDHDRFYYNRSVNNVNVTEIHNTYNTTIVNNNTTINRVSYNGGNGGINERPTAEEEAAGRGRHIRPVGAQNQHFDEARSNRELRASVNHGKPPVAATQRPGAFHDRNAMAAREAGGRYEPPANRKANADRPPSAGRPTHAKELSPHERFAPPNTGNSKRDQKYQQQQDKLYAKQEQEHQKLQQKQEQEHQRLVQQNASDARRQQTEQRHQQQTQHLEQRHEQQRQQIQQKQQPPRQPQSRPGHP